MPADANIEPQAQTARAIAWALNRVMVLEQNPEATSEEIREAWEASKVDMVARGRKIFASLENRGFTMTPPETVSEED